MAHPTGQQTFPFYEEHKNLKQLVAELEPHVRQMVDEHFTEVLAELVIQVGRLECRLDDLRESLQKHRRSHRGEIDAADWWKHGSDPT